ncbi:MAG: hypothetical protein ACI4LR_00510 [Treponema sp.]
MTATAFGIAPILCPENASENLTDVAEVCCLIQTEPTRYGIMAIRRM